MAASSNRIFLGPEFRPVRRQAFSGNGRIYTHPARPNDAPRIIIPGSPPLSREDIRLIDPTTLKPVDPINLQPAQSVSEQAKAAPCNKSVPSSTTKRWTAAMVAGAAAFLTPALAYAGSLTATVESVFTSIANFLPIQLIADVLPSVSSHLTPIGIGLAALGLVLTGQKIYSLYKATRPENYQSPQSRLVTGNPTIRKIRKQLILPAFVATVGVGAFMAYGGDALIYGKALTWWAFYLVAGTAALNFLARTVRDSYHQIRFAGLRIWGTRIYLIKPKYEQQNLVQGDIHAKHWTNFWGNGAWVAGATFMAHVAGIFTKQFVDTLFLAIRNGYLAPLATGEMGLTFAGIAIFLHLAYRGALKRIGNPLEDVSPVKSLLVAALKGAAMGVVLYCTGIGHAATLLFVFAINIAFAHNFVHSSRSQESGLTQKEKKRPVHPLQDLWRVVRNPAGTFRTVFKPAPDMIDPLISGYIMMLASEGANWVLNPISGAYNAAQYRDAQQMVEKLIRKDAAILKRIIRTGYNQPVEGAKPAGYRGLMQARTVGEACEAAAVVFDSIARFLDDDANERPDLHQGHPIAWGDLKARSGFGRVKDKTFCAGVPLSKKPDVEAILREEEAHKKPLDHEEALEESRRGERMDQDQRVHGEMIRYTARMSERQARNIRGMAEKYPHAELESFKKHLAKKLEAAYRRASAPIDTHPGRFYTNFLPDGYNAKQFLIDLCSQIMAGFVSFSEIGVMNAHGKIEIWAVPLRVCKDIKKGHEDLLSIESRDEQGEDLRFEWYDRFDPEHKGYGGHVIGDSLCEIAYIDNYAHWLQNRTDLSAYPTAEVPPSLSLQNKSLYDPYLRITEKQEFLDVVYKNGARLRVFGDGSHRLIEGELPEHAAALLVLPRTERHEFVKQEIGKGRTDEALNGIRPRDRILQRLAQGDVPHPFGTPKDSMSKDPYLLLREHHMYPTWRTGISDADQADYEVSNQELVHAQANPHLRLHFRVPEREELPFNPDMVGREYDSFYDAAVVTSWMVTRVKLKDGRDLYFPLNINKENERTLGNELWRYIDERRNAAVVEREGFRFLNIPLRTQSWKDYALLKARMMMEAAPLAMDIVREDGEVFLQVPLPIEMEEMAEEISEVRVNPVRFGEVGGPIAVGQYIFTRRRADGKVTDRKRTLGLSDRVTDMFIFGIISLMSKDEMEHRQTVGAKDPQENYAYVDEDGMVHMRMSKEESEELGQWFSDERLKPMLSYHGRFQPVYREGEFLMSVWHFKEAARQIYDETRYQGFMPDKKYRKYFEIPLVRGIR